MDARQRIRTAFERNARALTLRPTLGRRTARTHVRVTDGLACEIRDGAWTLAADLSERSGGIGSAPDPGVLLRGAFGACLATTYAQWAAKLDIDIRAIEVEVTADFDSRGHYGVADVPAGYSAVRYRVTVESDAADTDIERLLDAGDAHAPYFDVFNRAVPLTRELHVRRPER